MDINNESLINVYIRHFFKTCCLCASVARMKNANFTYTTHPPTPFKGGVRL